MLAVKNKHERDDNIKFFEEGHRYEIKGIDSSPISVTTLIHKLFPSFDPDTVIDKMMNGRNWKSSKYYGMTKDEIKKKWNDDGEQASRLGTLMHADIERILNNEDPENPGTIELRHFESFWQQFQKTIVGFYPYRTEWLVYDEDKCVAGSIDCVLKNSDGHLIILDWKRSKEIKLQNKYERGYGPLSSFDNCNYCHYSLQLNIYRHILETKYKQRVVGTYIVVLHPNNPYYEVHGINKIDIASMWDEMIDFAHISSNH